jgi:drug/metabolite transporter (DMT)-like permease
VLLSLVEPLAAAVLAALVLGDRLSATGMAGAVTLLAAVVRTVRADSVSHAVLSLAAHTAGKLSCLFPV